MLSSSSRLCLDKRRRTSRFPYECRFNVGTGTLWLWFAHFAVLPILQGAASARIGRKLDEREQTLTKHRVRLLATAASMTAGRDATSASSTSAGEIGALRMLSLPAYDEPDLVAVAPIQDQETGEPGSARHITARLQSWKTISFVMPVQIELRRDASRRVAAAILFVLRKVSRHARRRMALEQRFRRSSRRQDLDERLEAVEE